MMLKVNYFPHQMAITLTENGSLVKTRKAEQETSITPEPGVDYGVGTTAVAVNAVSSGVWSSRAWVARKLSTPVISRMTEWCTTRSTAASVVIGSLKMRDQAENTRLVVIKTERCS